MKIRAMQLEDMEEVVGMMRVFYDSPAVIHVAPDEILRQDVKDCVGECPYIEGYIFEEDGKILGYSMVAKSYSTEYGGMCVWVEDLYMKEEARGLGIGTAFFRFLMRNTRIRRCGSAWKWKKITSGQWQSTKRRDISRCRICR